MCLSEQREQEAERLTKEAAGLRREGSLLKAELEARGEALRQVMDGCSQKRFFLFLVLFCFWLFLVFSVFLCVPRVCCCWGVQRESEL